MATDRNRQRTKLFSIRLNPAEWAAVQERANAESLSVGAVFRRAVLKTRRDQLPPQSFRPSVDHAALGRLMGHVGKIGSNVNQLAHVANLGGWPEHAELAAACADIRAMRDAVFAALGMDLPRKAEPAP